GAVFVEDRLVAGHEVDDREPAAPERDPARRVHEKPPSVGTAVNDRPQHAQHLLLVCVSRGVQRYLSRDSTHAPYASLPTTLPSAAVLPCHSIRTAGEAHPSFRATITASGQKGPTTRTRETGSS